MFPRFPLLLLFAALAGAARAQPPVDDIGALGMKVSVTIVFDTSGSMNENNKLAMAKQAFGWWLETAPQDTIVSWSLWTFDPRSNSARNLVDRKPGAAREVQQRINGFVAEGGTPLGATLTRVARVIDAENKKAEEGKADILRQVVLIFTDGKDSNLSVAEVQKIANKVRDAGAEVFSIGYQGEGDYLAKVSDKFLTAADEKQLKSGLSEFNYFIEKPNPVR